MSTVQQQIENGSAIPSWSGFIYQGKVALYHCIKMLTEDSNASNYLKVETLEDFVIYDQNDKVLSLHQVKAKKSTSRSDYKVALEKTAKITNAECDDETIWYFHVSTELNDFSNHPKCLLSKESEVSFYTYHDERKYVETGKIDNHLAHITEHYLSLNELDAAEHFIKYKLARLEALLAGKVNLAHHRNQHEHGMTKLKAANSIRITFAEIRSCLDITPVDTSCTEEILFEFRRSLLEKTNQLLIDRDLDDSYTGMCFDNVCACRHAIAKMDDSTLERLYFSKKPNHSAVSMDGIGDDAFDNYMEIVTEIIDIIADSDLPHYFKRNYGRFLPTAITMKRSNKSLNIRNIQKNVSGLLSNKITQDVLYDYEHLIVDMIEAPFKLKGQGQMQGRILDVNDDDDNSRLTKINNVRFVSIKDAGREIND